MQCNIHYAKLVYVLFFLQVLYCILRCVGCIRYYASNFPCICCVHKIFVACVRVETGLESCFLDSVFILLSRSTVVHQTLFLEQALVMTNVIPIRLDKDVTVAMRLLACAHTYVYGYVLDCLRLGQMQI